MKNPITLTAIEKIQPKDTLWDTKVAGFGVRRQKDSISYILKTRVNGRQKLITIGKHGSPWTPETARKKAQSLLTDINNGIDPSERKRIQNSKISVQKAWEQFVLDHISKLKPRTREGYIDLFKRYISPAISSKSIQDVSRQDVAAIHRKLSDKPSTGNYVLSVLSKFMNWAELLELRNQHSNPTTGLKKYTIAPRERFLSQDEYYRLGLALQAEIDRGANPYAIAAIQLLMFTGTRKGEILELEWKSVDLEH